MTMTLSHDLLKILTFNRIRFWLDERGQFKVNGAELTEETKTLVRERKAELACILANESDWVNGLYQPPPGCWGQYRQCARFTPEQLKEKTQQQAHQGGCGDCDLFKARNWLANQR
jgi:hypothetical protein